MCRCISPNSCWRRTRVDNLDFEKEKKPNKLYVSNSYNLYRVLYPCSEEEWIYNFAFVPMSVCSSVCQSVCKKIVNDFSPTIDCRDFKTFTRFVFGMTCGIHC